MKPSKWLSLLGLALVTSLASGADAKVKETFEQVIPFDAGGTFSIENKNGSITVQTWNEPNVRIEAVKSANRESDLENIEILIDGSGSSVSVETVHQKRRFWGSSGSVKYNITLPADAEVDVTTVNGAVTIEGIDGRVVARSVNGTVKMREISGEIETSTTNGSIRAEYARADEGEHSFKTTNGSVSVYLPSDAGGQFEAKTTNGSIRIDFPTELSRETRRHKRGTFGSGSSTFAFKTTNGSVKILQN